MSAQSHCYQDLQANMPAIKELADAMLQAKFFGLANKGAALVVAVELYVTGESPMEYQRRNGFVGGNPYTPYDAMIAAFQEAGGKVKLISKTSDLASVELTYAGETTPFSLSWEDASKEAFVYEGKTSAILQALAAGKTPSLKPKYATPRSRAIMLYARLIDDAIRSVASGVNFGRYTAEVVEDIPAVSESANDPSQPVKTSSAVVQRKQQAPPQQTPPQQQPPQQQPPVNNVAKPSATEPAAESVVENVEVSTDVQADQQVSAQDDTELSTPTESSDAIKAHITDPCTDSHRAKILDLISQFAQDGHPEVKQAIVDRLRLAGLPSLNALTITEAEQLIHALEVKQIKTWVDSQIEGHMVKNQSAEVALGNG